MKQNIRKVRHFWNLETSAGPTFDFLLQNTPYGQFARKFWQIGHNEWFSEESQEIKQVVPANRSKIIKTKPNECIFHSFANQMPSLISWMDQNFINFSNLRSNLLPDERFRPKSGFQSLQSPFFAQLLMISAPWLIFPNSINSRRCYTTIWITPPHSIRLFYADFNLLDCRITRKTRSGAGNP